MPEDTFINYTHPNQQSDKTNRRKVASYIGTHYRNRSRPAARKINSKFVTADDGTLPGSAVSASQDRNLNQKGVYKRRSPMSVHRDKHGLRTDPFTAYPIKSTACVPGAIDYFLHFFAPTHVIRPELVSADQSAYLVKQYFQYALSHEILFESIVSLSQINLTANRTPDRDNIGSSFERKQPDRDALFHHGEALRKLRKLLSDKDALMEDAVLFAIATLMGVDYFINSLNSFETHLRGLRRIIEMRGGSDALGWPMLLKPLLNSLEAIWSYMSHSSRLLTKASPSTTIPFAQQSDTTPFFSQSSDPELLPKDPYESPSSGWRVPTITITPDTLGWTKSTEPAFFSPCPASPTGISNLSYLPPGFTALALSHPSLLSLPVKALLHRISTLDGLLNHALPSALITRNGRPIPKKFDNAANLQEIEHCVQLLGSPELTDLERTTCTVMLCMLMESTRGEQMSAVWVRQCQFLCEDVLDVINNETQWEEMSGDERNCYIWAALDMAGTTVPPRSWLGKWPKHGGSGDKRLELAVRVVREYGSRGLKWRWEEVEEICSRFFWTDGRRVSWRNVWDLAERYLEEEEGERNM